MFLSMKYGVKDKGIEELCEEDKLKYEKAKVFTGEEVKLEVTRDPVIVCKKGEEIILDEDELNLS